MIFYSGSNEILIKNNLKWGKGPTIKIEQLGTHNGFEVHAKHTDANPNEIIIDIDLVNDLENSVSGTEFADGLMFLVGVTILHEIVHYSDYIVD